MSGATRLNEFADQFQGVQLLLCMEMGGSITGEHGVGSEKLDHVDLMFDTDDLDVMGRLRAVFDPKRLCNPGKAIPERHACGEVARWPQLVQRVLDEEAPAPGISS